MVNVNVTKSSEVIDALNDLIETCKDGEYGFRVSAEQAKSSSLRSNLLARSSECATAADQLRAHVVQLGGKPEDSGSLVGAVHRGWVAVKAKLSTYDDLAVLEECERGEDAALATYRDALDSTALPPPIRNLVEHQYEGAKRNHDQVRRMRDALRATQKSPH
jgi:uncharacterized protein (TIGR02284 family)